MKSIRYKWLYIVYIVVWLFLAIDPKYFDDWLLENVLVVLFFPVVIWLDIRYKFSFMALLMVLVFSILHSIGSHFTYTEMSYFDTITSFFGFERNHYDRLVHFLFGALFFKFFYEIIFFHIKRVRVSVMFTLTVIISIATIYEVLEWGAVSIFYPELGVSFLGIQGDIWDAQKDTLVAIIGAIISGAVILLGNRGIVK